MEIKKAEFAKGVIGDDYGTKDNLPHIAFFGRSNAGKSSVINSLSGKKDLVKTSKLPGKTREANFFKINNSFYFVDFPGYGYAKRSISERNKMIKRIFWYLKFSKSKPNAVFLIIDAKVGITILDKNMIEVILENNHKVVIVANKIDKLKKENKKERFLILQKEAKNIPVLGYSAKTNEGREELIDRIASFL
ncbi:MAG: ribosome biogenesis GTP-binding protein YihA/YsxC [Candidatus Paceibacterota bacterium]|jgi:GTP-binding protein|nr:ribosome biogenesis GTP-binding protein YihA/YsxC [Candidatus Paceibacterota bacterium]MDD3072238.1 ribosome biogenesis GTP-binding protein YihA/YsxC [Candidatus Paceibacterota bacterium]MDD4201195.1 ribosome biogenesis GTP-binding protein YihA/YsxC [Candidatus Paceibacterota bacterium]MDD4897228.1 ribosome biogenesis GTP-binding protein YihA/YsxC [Candidatus Paceibacterota bacterium]